jgi:hypothetical protein
MPVEGAQSSAAIGRSAAAAGLAAPLDARDAPPQPPGAARLAWCCTAAATAELAAWLAALTTS